MRHRLLIAAIGVSLAVHVALAGAAETLVAPAQSAVRLQPVAAPSAAPGQPAAVPHGDPRKPGVAAWPAHGSIRYRVMYGEGGFEVGEAVHDWTHDDKRYRMSVTVKTTGVMGLLRSLQYEQRSEGRIGPKGLVPEQFRVEQSGKKPETAEFDWNTAQVTMRRGSRTRTAPVERGDQDLLSLWHQIGLTETAALPDQLQVVSGKSATPSVLERVGAERLVLPIGRLDTQRLRTRALNGKLSIDVWLAPEYGTLPVRIRITDDKGDVLDQQAVEVRLAPAGKPAAKPVGPGDGKGASSGPIGTLAAVQEKIELRADDRAAASNHQ
ncbi:DUF3108 domain-containing protein [Aromatoleum buckelii]|uniref:DUF3108 domain-containing protein n=1 Tax=Aromatoleum buckelii TaxID=200254 RepID=A0ABX1MWU9_9RHOO|nr:DUF3108 domain-containing protein [Aromatoleum buckelii]MCK0512334.1 DUF3108 domain-containing protein [Aromatoleum buckelii]